MSGKSLTKIFKKSLFFGECESLFKRSTTITMQGQFKKEYAFSLPSNVLRARSKENREA